CTDCRSGSLNLSLALNVFSKTAFVRRLRIFRRTRVWPPRAVGVFTSASRQQKGVFSSSNNVLRLTLIASISAAMKSFKQGGNGKRMHPIPISYQYRGTALRMRGLQRLSSGCECNGDVTPIEK